MANAAASDSPLGPRPPPPPPAVYFPLRWESTGDRWWYATPVDLAAANGHYELVRALLVADSNLLIKLTSLRRLRRLETLWDDHPDYLHAPRGRATVARGLLRDCESGNSGNSLIRGGYGGWLLYTAAAAGDIEFIQELLRRETFLVFGEGEYGITDILYAAARSSNSGVIRMLLGAALDVVPEKGRGDMWGVFRMEVMNRALYATARGGNWEMLKELLYGCGLDVMGCRDVQGCTILHAAAGRGQVEVVKNLVERFELVDSRDNNGNTALHLAAYRGHLEVVKVLVSSSAARNNAGDSFLHMAVAGFGTLAFRRIDRQIELMKQLICGEVVCLSDIINFQNNEGRTALHLAVIGDIHCDLVQLLMAVPSIDLNIRDLDGMTPLDLLNQRPRSGASEILKQQLTSAGGTSSWRFSSRSALVSELKMHNINCSSPGTRFRIPDSMIFLYTGLQNTREPIKKRCTMRSRSCSNSSNSEIDHSEKMHWDYGPSTIQKSSKSLNSAANGLRRLLGWSHKKEKSKQPGREEQIVDDGVRIELKHSEKESMEKKQNWYVREKRPTPLRQRFSMSSLPNNKRALSVGTNVISPSTKKKFAGVMVHGVMQGIPRLVWPLKSPLMCNSKESLSSPSSSDKRNRILSHHEIRPSKASNAVT